MNDEMKKDFLRLFGGDSESREVVYHFHETDESARALLKGENGMAYYEEIIQIAKEAGVSLEEVRNRFIPLLDQERFKAYTDKAAKEFIRILTETDAVDKYIESKKAESEEKRRRVEEAFAYLEEQKRNKKNWLQRLFS